MRPVSREKKFVNRLVIDNDLATTWFNEDTGHCAFAAAGPVVVLDCHLIS